MMQYCHLWTKVKVATGQMTSQMKESKKILLSLLILISTVEEQTKLIHRKKAVNFNILGIYNMYFIEV